MEAIPVSIWYEWKDGDKCYGAGSGDCYGVFSIFKNGSCADGSKGGDCPGPAKPAFHAASVMQKLLGDRPFVRRLHTSVQKEGPGQDPELQYVLGFGSATSGLHASAPVAVAQPKARIERLAVWSASDIDSGAVLFEPGLAGVCWNMTQLYGEVASHPYCFNATGYVQFGLMAQPTFYSRLWYKSESATPFSAKY